jgi:hypothetical protein
MKYDWEEGIVDKATMDEIEALLPEGIHLVAIAVDNAETCEGALIKHPDVPTAGILMADLFSDILGDAEGYYRDAVEAVREYAHSGTVH